MRPIFTVIVLAVLLPFSTNLVCSGCFGNLATESTSATAAHRSIPIPSDDLRFTEISRQAGITFKHVFSPEKKYIAESMGGGVALFDYDNDGYLDIYFVNSLTV